MTADPTVPVLDVLDTLTPHAAITHADERGLRAVVLNDDCLSAMRRLPDNSIDAVVTDPPYGLSDLPADKVGEVLAAWLAGDREAAPTGRGFMGKSWDAFVPPPAVWDEVFRVLKPGGHVLAFAGTRTVDLMGLSIRLAGFEVRDSLTWIYGSGFPKSLDVSKAIDKATRGVPQGGADPTSPNHGKYRTTTTEGKRWDGDSGQGYGAGGSRFLADGVTAPAASVGAATAPESIPWQGWGTALKPASEPIVVARKPLDGTVAANVLVYGTGALNIDATRVSTADNLSGGAYSESGGRAVSASLSPTGMNRPGATVAHEYVAPAGRWPANVLLSHGEHCRQAGTRTDRVIGARGVSGFASGYQAGDGANAHPVTTDVWECVDGCPVAALDAQSGNLHGSGNKSDTGTGRDASYDASGYEVAYAGRANRDYGAQGGGASRFFPTFADAHDPLAQADAPFLYQAKASTRERPSYERESGIAEPAHHEGRAMRCTLCGKQRVNVPGSACACPVPDFQRDDAGVKGVSRVAHPTVKPRAVMEWLVRLVVGGRPDAIVLEPFAGSGTTVEACLAEGVRVIGVERDADYVPLIAQRVDRVTGKAPAPSVTVVPDTGAEVAVVAAVAPLDQLDLFG